MSNTTRIVVYTLETCPNCDILKEYLGEKGTSFEVKDMMSAEALTELRVNGVFVIDAPVLQKEKTFLTSADLFLHGTLNEEIISPLIEGE